MSKKMMKRSLALGALMAFVITGSAMAATTELNIGANQVEELNTIRGSFDITGAEGSTLKVSGDAIVASGTMSGIGTLEVNSSWAAIYGDFTGNSAVIEAKNIKLTGADNNSIVYIPSNVSNKIIDIDFSKSMVLNGWNAVSNHGANSSILIDGGEGSTFTANVDGNGIWVLADAEDSVTSIKADIVNISSSKNATTICVYGDDSTVNIEAKELTLIRNADDKCVAFLGSGSEGAELNIKATEKATIKGDLRTDTKDSIIKMDITGAESTFTGKTILNNSDAQINLVLNNGATWNVTGESNVSKIAGNSANIKVEDAEEAAGWVKVGEVTATKLTVATETNDANTNETLTALSKVAVDAEDNTKAVATQVQLKNAIYDNVTATVNGFGDVAVNEGSKQVAEANIAANDMAAVGLMSWRAEMNDMNKRMGELRNANGEHGVWVRMVRGESEYNSVKNQYNQYQLGYDEKLSVDKRWTVGVALSYTDAENNFAQGTGESTNKALSIYGSKLNADGTFVDLIAKYARLENEFNIVSGMGDAEYDANGYSVSAEFGKRIQQGKGLWIEPQVELTYGKVGSADYVTANGVNVAQDGMESLVGRVGFSLGKDIEKGNVYARASYLYDFDGETKATLNNDAVLEQDLGGGWWEVGVGANINLSKATYIYADIEKTFGGEVDTNWQWNLGVRYSF